MKKYLLFLILIFLLFIQHTNAQTIITGAEYFFDVDPGFGQGTPLSPEDGAFDSAIEKVISNNYHNLEPGIHVVNVRGKNSENNWGPVTSRVFSVTQTTQSSGDDYYIAGAEFFFDTDPGEGNGYPLNAVDGDYDSKLENVAMDNIDLDNLSDGTHTVFVRGMRSDNRWGEVESFNFIIDRTPPVDNKPPSPTGLIVESASNNTVDLIWDFASDITQISYRVYRSEIPNGIFYKVNKEEVNINNVVYGKVKYADQGLKNDRTYYYKVKSFLNGLESDDFSNMVSATPQKRYNFQCKPVTKTSQIVRVNNTVKYHFQVFKKEGFQGSINMTCTGLPEDLKYEFSLNNYPQGSAISITDLPASVTLKISAGSAASFGEHEFDLTVQNLWKGGSSLFMVIPIKLTVVSNNDEGIFVALDKINTYTTQKRKRDPQFSKISTRRIEAPITIDMGEVVEIYGAISTYAQGEQIAVTITNQNGESEQKILETTSGGKFNDIQWISTLSLGTYEINASWTDSHSNTYKSNSRTFKIVKGESELTCLRQTDAAPKLHTDFSISGNLKPVAPYDAITLCVISPDDEIASLRSLKLDNSGQYETFDSFFTKKGTWKFKAYWPGNETHIGCESDTLSIPVGIDYGRVIILAGGEAEENNAFWKVTKTLSVKAYRNFKFMGFTDDMIYYFINSPSVDIDFDGTSDDVVDMNRPTVNSFLDAIENSFENDVDADTPLYIYMIGHGTSDGRFKVLGSDQYVRVDLVKSALDTLQDKTGCQIVFILESCFSGNFINGLIGNNRILISSIDDQRYIIDAKGEIVFSRFLFSNLSDGDSLGKAFQKSKQELTLFGYPPPIIIDDNVNNDLSADNIFVTGQIHYGESVEINEVILDNVLDENDSTLPLSVKASGDVDILDVWAIIIAPNVNVLGSEQTIAYPEAALTYNNETNRYTGELTNLNIPGVYKVVIMAKNILHEVSAPYVEYVSNTSVVESGDVNGDNKVDIFDAIMVLRTVCLLDGGVSSSLADVNGDNKIGLYEVVYILTKIGDAQELNH